MAAGNLHARLFLFIIGPLSRRVSFSPSLLPYARRIENNSATDGRRHARPCPTRLRIHFICARGEWIKINDGWTFIAFWGWRRDWGGETQVAEWDWCLILSRSGRQFETDGHTVLAQRMKTELGLSPFVSGQIMLHWSHCTSQVTDQCVDKCELTVLGIKYVGTKLIFLSFLLFELCLCITWYH